MAHDEQFPDVDKFFVEMVRSYGKPPRSEEPDAKKGMIWKRWVCVAPCDTHFNRFLGGDALEARMDPGLKKINWYKNDTQIAYSELAEPLKKYSVALPKTKTPLPELPAEMWEHAQLCGLLRERNIDMDVQGDGIQPGGDAVAPQVKPEGGGAIWKETITFHSAWQNTGIVEGWSKYAGWWGTQQGYPPEGSPSHRNLLFDKVQDVLCLDPRDYPNWPEEDYDTYLGWAQYIITTITAQGEVPKQFKCGPKEKRFLCAIHDKGYRVIDNVLMSIPLLAWADFQHTGKAMHDTFRSYLDARLELRDMFFSEVETAGDVVESEGAPTIRKVKRKVGRHKTSASDKRQRIKDHIKWIGYSGTRKRFCIDYSRETQRKIDIPYMDVCRTEFNKDERRKTAKNCE